MKILKTKYVSVIPKLSEEEYNQLEANIKANGCMDAIKVNKDDVILDGHNRYKICSKNNLPFKTEVLDLGNENDETIWIIRNQFGRRNITDFTRIELGLELKACITKKAKENQVRKPDSVKPILAEQKLNTREEIAKVAKVSHGNVTKAQKIKEVIKDEKVLNDLRSGKTTINKVHKDIRTKEIAVERKKIADEGSKIEVSDRYTVELGDISKWNTKSKFDFIITDPPYPKEFLSLYTTLAKRAKEWLKPNGLLIAMAGQSYLDEIVKGMSSELTYYWTAAYLLPGQPTPLRQRQVNTSWKPLMIYSNDDYKGKIFGDVFKSDANDKDFHKWGQSVSGMYDIISKICLPGQSILDPFCGAGTTGVAAIKHGCLFTGIDIELDNVNISKKRIGEVK